jgi:8-oxo-dGTP pyrophosphatase MutT (NUDIX family)
MDSHLWAPHTTVAALIERDGRFLLVEEETVDGLRLNQPAGHLEPSESLLQAVVRESLEETAREFVPQALVGVYMTRFTRVASHTDITYVRFTFCGTVGEALPGRSLDQGIVRTVWLTADEIRASRARHRTPLVERCVDDYLAGKRFPLDLIYTDWAAPKPDVSDAVNPASGSPA